MKKIIMCLALVLSIVSLTGCGGGTEESKPKLYKYDIDDLDYSDETIYQVGYSGTNYFQYLSLSSNGTCFHQSNVKNAEGSMVVNSTKCSYSISGKEISIIEDTKSIWTPTGYGNGFVQQQTDYNYDVNVNGIFSEKNKKLTIGNTEYLSGSYMLYIKRGMEEVLIDPNNNNLDYRIDGTRDWGYEPQSIDLSEYEIIDMSNGTNTTD